RPVVDALNIIDHAAERDLAVVAVPGTWVVQTDSGNPKRRQATSEKDLSTVVELPFGRDGRAKKHHPSGRLAGQVQAGENGASGRADEGWALAAAVDNQL